MTSAIPFDYVYSDSHLVPDLGLNRYPAILYSQRGLHTSHRHHLSADLISVYQLCSWVDHQQALLQAT
ncbi:unnamed protein product [Staurois parvus]|uniref:Uncharacterized protein n=1 Tax=Staurois parvus TaxID=386267 RepID=A0ABN9HKS7_9NEOB|nr:unnamed protein product [Staurois parvus]